MAEDKKLQGDPEEARKVLLEQAAALDIEVGGRWSVETLADKVREAQEAKDAADKAKFKATAKTPVFLLRDAFPVTDEKHLAGETIDVPVEMARTWIAAGVARDARPLPNL